MNPPPSQRIVGLDAWRALLMAAGLFVHGGIRLEPTMVSTIACDLSQAFRMGAFFAVSGFLAALVLPRRDPAAWLRQRLVRLGIPALFGMSILAPMIWWMTAIAPPSAGRDLLPFEWHHLWFLVALIGYSIAIVPLELADRRTQWLMRVDTAAQSPAAGRLALLGVTVASAALFGIAPVVMRACLPRHLLLPFANLQSIAGYLPLFLFGAALARCPTLRAAVLAERRSAVLIVVAGAAAILLASTGLIPSVAGDYVRFVTATLCPPAAVAVILHKALSVQRVPAAVQRIAEASYTIYLLHLPIAVAVNVTVGRLLHPVAAYLLCVPVAGIGAAAVHHLAARHAPALLLLFNGQVPPRYLPRRFQWTKRATTSR